MMKTNSYSEVEYCLRENYLSGPSISIQPILKGVENQNYRVEFGGQAYVLRVYSREHSTTGLRNKSEIAFELDFMEHVREQGVPTPVVFETAAGAKVAELSFHGESHFAVLFSFVAGQEAPAYHPENARLMAETLLKMHKASQTYRYDTVRRWPGNILGESLAYYRDNRGIMDLHRDKLDALYAQAAAEYRQIQSQPLPTGIVHGDIKLENVLFAGNAVTAVLDFDDYRESYLLEDFTRTVMHDLDSVERNVIRSGQYEQFLTMFAGDMSISAAEMGHLAAFLKARFLYDVTVYRQNGHNGLVAELFTDPHVAEVILA